MARRDVLQPKAEYIFNLYDWFTKAALTQTIDNPGTPYAVVIAAFTPTFRKLIDKAYPRDNGDDCMDEEHAADIWHSHLTPKGIAFTLDVPHDAMARSEDAVIPFDSLASYLTPTGKAQIVARFRAEIGGMK